MPPPPPPPADRQPLLERALAHLQAGRSDQAEADLRSVLAQSPDDPDALHLMGVTLHGTGRSAEGFSLVRRAAELRPGDAKIFNNLGEIARSLNRRDEAVAAYRRAVEIDPSYAVALSNLGLALLDLARYHDAVAAFRRAIALQPNYAKAHRNLGLALHQLGSPGEALDAYAAALRLDPRQPDTLNNLANVLRAMNRYADAAAALRQAIALRPDYVPAHNNLGDALARQGEIGPAIASYRRALELNADSPIAWDSLLFTFHYSERTTQAEILAEHRRWSDRFEAPLIVTRRPHDNDRSSERRLRVGYVSPDFRRHPVGYFLRPLFQHHDPERVEVFAYATMPRGDEQTDFFRARTAPGGWRDAYPLTDEQLADQIRADRIDILVDTTLHMANNRLLAFARKPAPVQVTYLGYPHTTGLRGMDFRLTDPYLDPVIPYPPGEPRPPERLAPLPDTFFCCDPDAEGAPDVGDLPAHANGFITFACSNTLMKVSDGVVDAWTKILARVPAARLMLIASGLGSPPTQQRLRDRFAAAGLADSGRLELIDLTGVAQGLEQVRRGDIALDTFPYSGGTTSCNSLWMGLPLVTLAAPPFPAGSPVGRQGVSLLNNLGLSELIAATVEEYIDLAATLAADLARPAALRAGLRDRFRRSPLTDGPRFARGVEAAYRAMWRDWCARGG